MKYIRTKDGRICDLDKSISNIKIWCSEHCYSAYLTRKEIERFKNMAMLCKQADTIEELCDEFVYKKEKVAPVINKENPHLSYILVDIDDMTPFDTRRMVYLKDLVEPLYGAIWTDKGLIYVAKMNEKGELELL